MPWYCRADFPHHLETTLGEKCFQPGQFLFLVYIRPHSETGAANNSPWCCFLVSLDRIGISKNHGGDIQPFHFGHDVIQVGIANGGIEARRAVLCRPANEGRVGVCGISGKELLLVRAHGVHFITACHHSVKMDVYDGRQTLWIKFPKEVCAETPLVRSKRGMSSFFIIISLYVEIFYNGIKRSLFASARVRSDRGFLPVSFSKSFEMMLNPPSRMVRSNDTMSSLHQGMSEVT